MPGAGGTQRLPRIVGPSQALKIMLSGVPVPAKKALDQGILDSISTGDLVEDAISFLHKKLDETTEHPKVRDLNEKLVEARGNENVMAEAKALASKSRKGQFAPGQIIKLSLIHI